MSAPSSLEIYLKAYAQKNPQKIPESELTQLAVPDYIKKRIADSKYEKNWLVQLLSNMDADSSTSTPLPSDENGGVKKLTESFEDKRKSICMTGGTIMSF